MLKMTVEEEQAYKWALHQPFESVAARYARVLARYIERSLADEQAADEAGDAHD